MGLFMRIFWCLQEWHNHLTFLFRYNQNHDNIIIDHLILTYNKRHFVLHRYRDRCHCILPIFFLSFHCFLVWCKIIGWIWKWLNWITFVILLKCLLFFLMLTFFLWWSVYINLKLMRFFCFVWYWLEK